MEIPEHGFYIHYKHDPHGPAHNYTYEVIGIARHTEEKSFLVLYRPLYENDWMAPAQYQARPIEMFMDEVEKGEIRTPRFRRVTDADQIASLEEVRKKMYG